MIRIIKGDVFDYHSEYTLVHCISLDCKMGAGIAKEVSRRFPNTIECTCKVGFYFNVGSLSLDSINRIIHLYTKDRYYDKPRYIDFEKSLLCLKYLCQEQKITKLVMPKIGCGLDKLDWKKVLPMIEYYLQDIEDVVVCIKEG